MDRLAGKTALVTGAASGIGLAIAQKMAREGARVSVVDVNLDRAKETAAQIAAQGGTASAFQCDVSDHDKTVETFRSIDRDTPHDILVNNAGIAHIGNVEATKVDDLDRLYAVNVRGVYNGIHALIGAMVERGDGAIVNLASITSKVGIADRFAYSMTKGAVLTMTRSVAKDYVTQGIRCNCVCPARVHTPFVDKYLSDYYPGREKEMFEGLSAYQPQGRMGQPEEIANLITFLCSDEAKFITGAAVDIDGGVLGLR